MAFFQSAGSFPLSRRSNSERSSAGAALTRRPRPCAPRGPWPIFSEFAAAGAIEARGIAAATPGTDCRPARHHLASGAGRSLTEPDLFVRAIKVAAAEEEIITTSEMLEQAARDYLQRGKGGPAKKPYCADVSSGHSSGHFAITASTSLP